MMKKRRHIIGDTDGIDPEQLEEAIGGALGTRRLPTRDRPYDGQPHTDNGLRGKTLVSGLTMRDIADCIIMGMLESSPEPAIQHLVEDGTWVYDDAYSVGDIDPIAVTQNALCNVEKMMGIYPNIPKDHRP